MATSDERIYRCEACGSFEIAVPERGAYLADRARNCRAPDGPRAARCVYKRMPDGWPGVTPELDAVPFVEDDRGAPW